MHIHIIYICACYILDMKESIESFLCMCVYTCIHIYMYYIHVLRIYMYMYVFPAGSL